MAYQQIGEQFLKYYYSIYDSAPAERAKLAPLYQASSMLTVESDQRQGPQAIIEKLQSFPQLQHAVKSAQYQPTAHGTVLILVSGDLKFVGEANAIKFSQVFQLAAADALGANFYIQNDIFSLNYG